MTRALGLVIAVAAASSGCGDNLRPSGLTPDELFARLRALPGVTVRELPTSQVDLHYYVMHFTQPVDHKDPGQGTFQQEVSLLHRSDLPGVPVIVHTSGYADTTQDHQVELTKLLAANQVSIEHRYFGESRPVPTDWTKLTIEQAADDEHEIIQALRTIYAGSFITTGTSKGGMTAVFHRRFHDDDVDGTVAYVAPLSFGTHDPRYADFIEGLGDQAGLRACWQAVRDVATELLQNRRTAMCSFAEQQPDHAYTRVELGPAVEAAIVSLEWTFWQYSGVDACSSVPPRTADDRTLFAFLDKMSPVSDNDDEKVARFEAYYYQSYAELGYPDNGADYLSPFLYFDDSDYEHELPVPEPTFDSDAMRLVQDYIDHHGSRLLFVYGQWDPWTGGRVARGNAVDSLVLIAPDGNHWSKLANLELSDREEAFTRLKNWTGVTPVLSRVRRAERASGAPLREPPVLLHAPVAPK